MSRTIGIKAIESRQISLTSDGTVKMFQCPKGVVYFAAETALVEALTIVKKEYPDCLEYVIFESKPSDEIKG